MGQKFKIYDIHCGKCSQYVLTYHKYGSGKGILRLYFHRIKQPQNLILEINDPDKTINDIPHLKCPSCNEVLGVAAISKGKKGAFRMRQGYFHRKLKK